MKNTFRTIRSPFSVNYEVTPVCNLRCNFCFAESELKLRHPAIETVRQIIEELAAAEVFEIRLFGGEFFTYPEWLHTTRYAYERGMFLSFVSNGTLIKAETVHSLMQYGVRSGAISIHGPEEIHDRITGIPGSFRKAIAGLRFCLDGGLNITVLTTITQEGKNRIPELLTCLNNEGLVRPSLSYAVNRLCPFGRGKENWDRERISLDDYLNLFPVLDALSQEYGIETAFGDAFPHCLVNPKYHHLIQGCWQGTGFGHVNHAGEVRGCATSSGSYGNLLKTPLEKIWQGKQIRQFRKLQWLPKECQTCKDFCGGGCSASRLDEAMYSPDEFLENKT